VLTPRHRYVHHGITKKLPGYGGFQQYTLAKAVLTAHLPDSMSFADGSVVPACFSTAVVALSGGPGMGLGLPYPSTKPVKPIGKVVVLWGASSAVGLQFLQVARAVGVTTIATASPHNFRLVKSAGASKVYDYRSATIVQDLLRAVKDAQGDFAGVLDCISILDQSLEACISLLEGIGGGKLAVLDPVVAFDHPDNVEIIRVMGQGDMLNKAWEDYIPAAFELGALKCLPESLIAGNGLKALQAGLDILHKGVSAKKVVVILG
jgi:D-arabinose 1-dehydrogenase-like Zn-dependent alcohol dehydrogenase